MSYMEDFFHRFYTIKNVSLFWHACKIAKAKASALRMELV
jgi:hypothetical protein